MSSFGLGVDVRMLQHTGIGTYVRGLVNCYQNSELIDHMGPSLFGDPALVGTPSKIPVSRFSSPIYSIREQIEYLWQVRRCGLWHAPHYNVPFLKGDCQLVVTIHDLIHWIFRKDFYTPVQTFYAGKMISRAVQTADHIITVSKATRDDLITHFDADPDQISVIYEGVDQRFKPVEDDREIERVKEKYGLPETYFLYVGMIKPHKNVLWLMHLFKNLLAEKRIDAGLVLVGKKDKKYPAGYEALSRLENQERMVHIPYVEAKDLVTLYNGALALVHPSLYEGFGLTLLESMACGTPVIACRAASIPEVVGDAACLIESCAHYEMMDAIVRMEKSESLREDLSKRGLRHVSQFKWETAAKETVEVYEQVLET